MNDEILRVPADHDTVEQLRDLASAERRDTSQQAAILLARAVAAAVARRATRRRAHVLTEADR